jgi:hypothetical protein
VATELWLVPLLEDSRMLSRLLVWTVHVLTIIWGGRVSFLLMLTALWATSKVRSSIYGMESWLTADTLNGMRNFLHCISIPGLT